MELPKQKASFIMNFVMILVWRDVMNNFCDLKKKKVLNKDF